MRMSKMRVEPRWPSRLQFASKLADDDDDEEQCNDQQSCHDEQYQEVEVVGSCDTTNYTVHKPPINTFHVSFNSSSQDFSRRRACVARSRPRRHTLDDG